LPSRETSGSTERPRRFRLRFEVGGQVQRVKVRRGESTIGSRRENSFVFPLPGVSRRHAALTLRGDVLTIRDLGSKNGVFVNGKKVDTAPLQLGDVIDLGALRVRVEKSGSSDEVLAINIDGGARAESRSGSSEQFVRREPDEGPRWAALLAQLAGELLAPGRPGVGDLFTEIVRELDAEGAALVEWSGSGAASVAVASDMPEALDGIVEACHAWALEQRGLSEPLRLASGCLEAGGWPVTVAATALAAGGVQALVVWGDYPRRAASLPVLEAILRMLLHSQPEHLALAAGGELREAPELAFPEGHLVGRSPAIRAVYEQVGHLVRGDIPVLLVGETGVGKEDVARVLHQSSARRAGPFQVVHCAAIPAELLEAELFGIEKGVATGVAARSGKFELARGGVVFLDEIGDTPPPLQAKILRVLQLREVVPVGSGERRPVDVRVVAATNTDLEALVEQGRFRRDLYYRIAAFTLRVPPLRERREDIPALVELFVRRSAQEVGKRIPGVTVRALRALREAPWPGNVRQLEHEVRRLVYLCPSGEPIDAAQIPESVVARPAHGLAAAFDPAGDLTLAGHVGELERALIRAALARAKGNRSAAARLLGITRNGLALKLHRLGIEA
jgi:DNA-binding NtrC family response regulator